MYIRIDIVKAVILLLLMLTQSFAAETDNQPLIHHDLEVTVQNNQNEGLRVLIHDKLSWSAGGQMPKCFDLNSSLTITKPEELSKHHQEGIVSRYCVNDEINELTVLYHGDLNAISSASTGDYLYLDGSEGWYPQIDNALISFRMVVTLPNSWRSVSQGERVQHTGKDAHIEEWRESQPQQTIYLIAAELHEYSSESDNEVQAMVFLRQPEPEIAQPYLEATNRYIDFYSQLLGPYPYSKFALVENHWESGFGMPSFTLLGPRVIRLPFIIYTSYPHEIVHNWWGNSVYVDYESGNWAEGLTSYLADYWLREQRGEQYGLEYRRNALQRYSNFVGAGNEFALTQFRSRHNEVAQSVGYDKALMFFHMLRRHLGDEQFIAGLRHLYQAQIYRRASYTDLRQSFEMVSGLALEDFFSQWLQRSDVPELEIINVETHKSESGYEVSLQLRQTQAGPAYKLTIPLAVQLEGNNEANLATFEMKAKEERFNITVPNVPSQLSVDAGFDLIRRLDSREVPPVLSELFGASEIVIVLPAQARETASIYENIANAWASRYAAKIVWDDQITELPQTQHVWLLGWQNRFRAQLLAKLKPKVAIEGDSFAIYGEEYASETQGVVLVNRIYADNKYQTLAWLSWENAQSLLIMARKLRHYGKYSYLVFDGVEAKNIAKGQWPVENSPLQVNIPLVEKN